MDNQNALLAAEAASALLTVATEAIVAAQKINTVLGQAHGAGRDVTDDELQTAIDERHAAAKRLTEVLGAGKAGS